MTRFQLLLLEILIDGPSHAVLLIDRILDLPGPKNWFIRGRIYPALRELERDGLLTSHNVYENLAERGGHPRRIYEITDKGKKTLASELLAGEIENSESAILHQLAKVVLEEVEWNRTIGQTKVDCSLCKTNVEATGGTVFLLCEPCIEDVTRVAEITEPPPELKH